MKKNYTPKDIEKKIYKNWMEKKYFSSQNSLNKKYYSMLLPPPNITGSLHMGHGFQQTIMDCIIRYQYMNGKNTLWQPGTDHGGIATQIIIENQLKDEGKISYNSEEFFKKIWSWKEKSEKKILIQMKKLGLSCKWDDMKFSLDSDIAKATNQAFIQLYDEGLIYRDTKLINWDPKIKTAISDLEVIKKEIDGYLYYIKYKLYNSSKKIIVATTRPETILADTAIAVHPNDNRYKNIIGKYVYSSLLKKKIPIISDFSIDPNFGTGCVKVTPAHDFNDYEIGKRHNLPLINILNKDATLNANVPDSYQDLDLTIAKKKIIEYLYSVSLIEKIEPYKTKVLISERSSAIIQPYLSKQWFLKMLPLAIPAIKSVENKKIQFIPNNYKNLYFSWMNNIQDWCISRQLLWGHRIPVWYDKYNNIYLGENEYLVRKKYNISKSISLVQEKDVLDTWFTAALYPFSSFNWPKKNKKLKNFYPSNILVTGFDIIFFWVARMIMFGIKFMGEEPFQTIYIHGLIRDKNGEKMSKSKGNILDPVDLIDGINLNNLIKKRTKYIKKNILKEKIIQETKKEFPYGINSYGTDALRFTFCALSSTSRNIFFDIKRMKGYRNFCNKIWNIGRFIKININKNYSIPNNIGYLLINKWIYHEFNESLKRIRQAIKQYRFDLLTNEIYEFIWNIYCDWYLEICKVIFHNEGYSEIEKKTTKYILLDIFEKLLRVAHPVIPFITEEIWQSMKPITGIEHDSIIKQHYPKNKKYYENYIAKKNMEFIKYIIQNIRIFRKNFHISSKDLIPLYIFIESDEKKCLISSEQKVIQSLGRLQSIHFIKNKNPSEKYLCLSLKENIYIYSYK